jgi:hypothetical protein
MRRERALAMGLVGGALLAAVPATARAGEEDPSMKARLEAMEQQIRDLQAQVRSRDAAAGEPLSDQVDRYLQEQEKGTLWVDRNGKPLSKVVDNVWVTAWARVRPTWSKNVADMDDSVDDEGFDTFFRGGLGLGAKLKEKVSVYVGLDFAGTYGNTTTLIGNDTATTPTLQEAYIDGIYSRNLRASTRIGRFELEYGDEYVFGRTEFAQATTYFDGARIGWNSEEKGMSADVFAAKLVDGNKNPLTPTPDDSAYMAGVYGNYYGFEGKSGLPGGFEPYYVFIWDGQEAPNSFGTIPDPDDIHTAGFRWYGEKATKDHAGLGWNINANGQYNDDLEWSGDAVVRYTMPHMNMKPKVFGQAAYASGEHDGVTGYNPLWMDVHGRFGYADQFVFSNLAVLGGGLHVTPSEGLVYGVEVRSIHQARSTAVNSSKQLAWEFDFIVKHQYSDTIAVECAFSHVSFREVMNPAGGRADDVQRAYLQLVVSF